MLGEAHGYNVTPVTPGQFTSLPEAVCYVIQTLNAGRPEGKVTLDDVCCHLRRHFPHLELPDRAVIFSTLGRLVRERKIYHTRQGYQIVTPEKYQQQLAEELERDAVRSGRLVYRLVQTDLADIILGGSDCDRVLVARGSPASRSTATAPPPPPSLGLAANFGRRHSLKLTANQREEYFRRASSMRYPSGACLRFPPSSRRTFSDETPTSGEYSVLERPSLFSKLLRLAVPRRQLATFSAQFPPPEWTSDCDVTHLHSVGTQTAATRRSADRSPKLLRTRRQKKTTRQLNGSVDHLADGVETSVCVAEPQMAPRSSTLPRRTKLAEFLAETGGDWQKAPAKTGRQRSRTPRKRNERLKSPVDILRVAAPGEQESRKSRDAKGESMTGVDGVTVESVGGSPSHGESLAQRHVRERLEARARHSSSRTSSGSSLERSDTSPATSLERGVKLELPRPARDGAQRRVGTREERRSRSAAAARVCQKSAANPEEDPHVWKARDSPTHYRSSKNAGGLPVDSSHLESKESSRIITERRRESPQSRKQHKSPRRSNKESRLAVVDSKLKVAVDSKGDSNRETEARDGNTTPPNHQIDDSNRDSKHDILKSSRESKHHTDDSNHHKHRLADQNCARKPRQNGSSGADIKRNHGYVNQESSKLRSSAIRMGGDSLKTDPPQPVLGLSHVENREYFDVYKTENESETNRLKLAENEPVYQNIGVLAMTESVASPLVNGKMTSSGQEQSERTSRNAREREVTASRSRENGETPSPRRQESRDGISSPRHRQEKKNRHDDVTVADCGGNGGGGGGGEMRSSHHRIKDQNAPATQLALQRKQMNNEKILECVSPTRPERLSVKNIFHELSTTPAKVAPKSLPDGITPDPRLTRPLTYHDLVKSPPPAAKMADVTLTAAKMADETATEEMASESAVKRATSPGEASLRTYPSLSSLNLNFKSLAAQRLLHGASANSIDTLVEVNMAAERRQSAGSTETTLLGIL